MSFKSGFVTIIGNPNVGKSSLFNAILNFELSVVTHKSQTTRDSIKGILNTDNFQIVLSDTPGHVESSYLLHDKMNKNIMDMSYELLVVPQFTLAANTKSGSRPSFSSAADPIMSKDLFALFLNMLTQEYPKIHAGQFQANMQVSLINDGPVTFFLKVD